MLLLRFYAEKLPFAWLISHAKGRRYVCGIKMYREYVWRVGSLAKCKYTTCIYCRHAIHIKNVLISTDTHCVAGR